MRNLLNFFNLSLLVNEPTDRGAMSRKRKRDGWRTKRNSGSKKYRAYRRIRNRMAKESRRKNRKRA